MIGDIYIGLYVEFGLEIVFVECLLLYVWLVMFNVFELGWLIGMLSLV